MKNCGIRLKERIVISNKNPRINPGTICERVRRFPLSLLFNIESVRTTGPSIRIRINLTSVPMWVLIKETEVVAANTCGTAYTVRPANTPYCELLSI